MHAVQDFNVNGLQTLKVCLYILNDSVHVERQRIKLFDLKLLTLLLVDETAIRY